MASSHDLKEVLKDTLESRGVLGEIKARIRAEVFTALNDQSERKPLMNSENVLIYELIREFLDFNKCKYTNSVLISEAGLPQVPLDREFLRNELNVVEDAPSKSVPLLYSLVANYKESKNGNRFSASKPSHVTEVLGNSHQYNATLQYGSENDEPVAVIVKGGKL
ncbi:lisH domain-containing protein FOPNL [Biomphalaria glabrata]|uniref:Centrosomal protein 20 n=1 Tax=Biomphalaria glabrata TaxID=6526 RepID=A0A2C9JFJ0_BIOGL|nr:lisH domain-containing protein FOPNL-like [Biomphalaria glabrata]KAI8794037.1 lisH domain-containing protein FOPNL [Biomphalaria glabrata]